MKENKENRDTIDEPVFGAVSNTLGPRTYFTTGKILFRAGISLVLLVLFAHLLTLGRHWVWEDEIFVVSTGWSIAQAKPPIMSTLDQYPEVDSPVQFYGPVSFEAAAWLIRLFGLSIIGWRLACFAGVVLTLLVSTAAVRFAGGDRWAQLFTALVVVLIGSIASDLPGRWDFMTVGLFLGGLTLLLLGIETGGTILLRNAAVAALLVGVALGSTPRTLTLYSAAFISMLLMALLFSRHRRRALLSSVGMFGTALLFQTLLLLPWRLNSFSWYAYVRQSTKHDRNNATPVTGPGSWSLGLGLHKSFFLVFLLLLLIGLLAAIANRRFRSADEKVRLRVFWGLFAITNLLLMLFLLGRSLGESAFWLPSFVIATLSWLDLGLLRSGRFRSPIIALGGACLLVLLFQESRNEAAALLTWNRSNNDNLTAFVARTVPKGAAIYGPISGFFYPAELSGSKYLYLYSQAREVLPWLPVNPDSPRHASNSAKIDEEICAQPTYLMWPDPDPLRQPTEEPMPQALRDRLLPKIGELRQPPSSSWKDAILRRIGPVGGKYGFPDVTIYPLKSLDRCETR